MTNEKINIAIAEACGWTFINQVDKHPHGLPPDGKKDRYTSPLPDYCNDLNAMHEAEKMLNAGQINSYLGHLYRFNKVAEVGSNPWEIIAARVAIHATAAQRAEAFLKTINKWED
jgi:hypothetical protein